MLTDVVKANFSTNPDIIAENLFYQDRARWLLSIESSLENSMGISIELSIEFPIEISMNISRTFYRSFVRNLWRRWDLFLVHLSQTVTVSQTCIRTIFACTPPRAVPGGTDRTIWLNTNC